MMMMMTDNAEQFPDIKEHLTLLEDHSSTRFDFLF